MIPLILALLAPIPTLDRCERAGLMLDQAIRAEVFSQPLDTARDLVGQGYPVFQRSDIASYSGDVQARRLRRLDAAGLRLYCEGSAGDRELIRGLADEPGDRSRVALILVAVGDEGALQRYRTAIARGFRSCLVLTGQARQLVATGEAVGIDLWFEAIRTNANPSCVASALDYTPGLATLAASSGYDYAGAFLSLWREDRGLYGDLVVGMLLRGARVEALTESCCSALRTVVAEASDLPAAESPGLDLDQFEERCTGEDP